MLVNANISHFSNPLFGNSYTTEFRQYDPRLGRWKSLDPLMGMFPSVSPYVAFANNPIVFTDPYGLAPGSGDSKDEADEKGEVFTGDDGKEYTLTHNGGKVTGEDRSPKKKYDEINQNLVKTDRFSDFNPNEYIPYNPEQGSSGSNAGGGSGSNWWDDKYWFGNGDNSGFIKNGAPLVNTEAKNPQGSAIVNTEHQEKPIDITLFTLSRGFQNKIPQFNNLEEFIQGGAEAVKSGVEAVQEYNEMTKESKPVFGRVEEKDVHTYYDKNVKDIVKYKNLNMVEDSTIQSLGEGKSKRAWWVQKDSNFYSPNTAREIDPKYINK